MHRVGVPHKDQPFGDSGSETRPTAIAICLALLRALSSQKPGNANG
jgi:hypothetical protein